MGKDSTTEWYLIKIQENITGHDNFNIRTENGIN